MTKNPIPQDTYHHVLDTVLAYLNTANDDLKDGSVVGARADVHECMDYVQDCINDLTIIY